MQRFITTAIPARRARAAALEALTDGKWERWRTVLAVPIVVGEGLVCIYLHGGVHPALAQELARGLTNRV